MENEKKSSEGKIVVMVNGLPGKMATLVAEAVQKDKRFYLIPGSLTGPEITVKKVTIGDKEIKLITPEERESLLGYTDHSKTIMVDFTHPSTIMGNIEFYTSHGMSFVNGTTGVNMKKAKKIVKGKVSAVIAPNMAVPVVVLQFMMSNAAKKFGKVFPGYTLEIVESHQAGKADTSGTAKAMVQYFNDMGIPFKVEQIKMIRDPEMQRKMGIPEKDLGGHAWHEYRWVSADGTVLFKIVHNINGRTVYIPGVLDSIVYADRKNKKGIKKMFSMINVLENK